MKSIFKFFITISFILFLHGSHGQSLVEYSDTSQKITSVIQVKSGESLWSIAAYLPFAESVNRHQVMLALFKANPQAFHISCNMNSLKSGVVLQVPALDVIKSIDSHQASQEIQRQRLQWHSQKRQPIHCVQSPDAVEKSQSIESANKPQGTTVPSIELPVKVQESVPLTNQQPTAAAKSTPSPDSSPQKTAETQSSWTWETISVIALLLLIVGAVSLWFILKSLVARQRKAQDDEHTGISQIQPFVENGIIPHANNIEPVTLTISKEQFEQLKIIQKYSETYRFHPLAEGILIGLLAFIAIFLTSYFIFYHALEAQKDEIREGLVRTAQAMTTTINTELHKTFTQKEQEDTESYQSAIRPFVRLLALNDQIKFVYTIILKDNKVYFILDPTPKGDADGDGVEDSVDIMQEYDDPSGLLGEALRTQQVVVTKEPFTDQWGTYFGAYVPFSDDNGNFVGVLGMDIAADNYFKRLMPIKRATVRAMMTGFFIAFIIGSIVWFTRNFSVVVNRNRLLLIKGLNVQQNRENLS